ncbi:MAG: MBL fold metallo-hydrolase [Myxococcales bacterium]|nr:MBL fold metallo-hydrolase [Myxococcales bacterium]
MRTVLDAADVFVVSEPVGPFAMNQYLVGCKRSGQGAIIDAGGPPAAFLQEASRRGVQIVAILQTHAHIDHVLGLPETRTALPHVPIWLHSNEVPLYEGVVMQARMFGLRASALPAVTDWIEQGGRIAVGDLRFDCLLTPGHSPGHICFHERSHGLLFGGDLLFRGSIGRTDLPGSDAVVMRQSLRQIMTLPDETRVFPGHMGDTTIVQERRSNPFIADALS